MATKIKVWPNCFLINAPAGSGKTTKIENMILDLMGENRANSVLCITYTNRAAEELLGRIEFKEVDISTIHSFINEFISIYFNHPEIIEFYFELFEDEIKNRIENTESKSNITKSNNKYIEKFGVLSFETIKKNISELSYNELAFSSLYYGGLSHDDLLYFSYEVMKSFPKIKKRLAQKYDYIFIDEYQDTSADVLRLFYNAVKETNTNLYLLGDKMQQIYKNYDGSFEEELERFNQEEKLDMNYRSFKPIVDVLNFIYNDDDFKQSAYKENILSKKPIVYIEKNPNDFLEKFSKNHQNALQLVIYNNHRFKRIKAASLFNAISQIESYSFGSKYSPADVLISEESPDDLIQLLNNWHQIYRWYQEKRYGNIIQLMKRKMKLESRFKIHWHKNKVELRQTFFRLFSYYEKEENSSIKEWLLKIDKENLMNKEFLEIYISNEEYKGVLSVPLKEFKNIADYNYNKYPKVSTQHGVKGEGHDEVIFVANNSNNPNVKVYEFFDLWANNNIDFTGMQQFYYEFKRVIDQVQWNYSFVLKYAKKDNITGNEKSILNHIDGIYEKFKDDMYFELVYSGFYEDTFERGRLLVKDMNPLFNVGKMEGILNAYKLFYVGCSRAKRELSVLIDMNQLKGEREKLIQKFEQCGFVVK